MTDTTTHPPRWLLYLTSAVTGFGVMAAEMSAGRLMAPYYGTSTMIWALLIGAVMVSLALGHLLGGRLSKSPRALKIFFALLTAAALILAVLPLISRPLMQQSLTWFRHGSLGILAASAVGVLGLLTLPIIVLGTSGPVLIHHAIDDRSLAGQIAGRLYAFGTLGSLIGTYLAGVVLVPLWGTTRTFWLAAALLIANGVLGLLTPPRRAPAVAATLIIALAATLFAPTRPVKPGPDVIFESESTYNYIQVRQQGTMRGLYLNDGFAVQTIYAAHEGGLALQGTWRYYARAPAWTTTGLPKKLLVLGLGGGGAAVSYDLLYPGVEITGVEIDEQVIDAGRTYMGLPPQTKTVTQDARTFLARTQERYDVIIVDAFDFPYMPFQLATQEFFQAVEAHLADGGVVVLNVGRYRDDHRVVDAVAQTLKSVFPRVEGIDVLDTNTVLIAARHPPDQDVGLEALNLNSSNQRKLRGHPLSPWNPGPDAPVLTDDVAPVEWLTDQVVLGALLNL